MIKDNIIIVIPAYNEASVLGAVISGLKKENYQNILVVDDGSNDDTAIVGRKSGAIVIRHPINLGFGAAVRSGLEYAVRFGKTEYIVTMDADGQHKVEDVERLVSALEKDSSLELILGARDFANSGVTHTKYISNLGADMLSFLLSGKYIRDTQTGLRLIKSSALNKINLTSLNYVLCTEMVLEAVRNNLKIACVTVPARYTQYSTSKQVRQKFSNIIYMIKGVLDL